MTKRNTLLSLATGLTLYQNCKHLQQDFGLPVPILTGKIINLYVDEYRNHKKNGLFKDFHFTPNSKTKVKVTVPINKSLLNQLTLATDLQAKNIHHNPAFKRYKSGLTNGTTMKLIIEKFLEQYRSWNND